MIRFSRGRNRTRAQNRTNIAVLLVLLLMFSLNPGHIPPAGASGSVAMEWEFMDTPYTWLNDAAWGDGIFVAVGGDAPTTDGAIYTSDNGSSWTRTMQVPDWLPRHSVMAVTYGHLGYAAVTAQGAILVSQDGQTWEGVQTAFAGFYDIVYANNLYIAVGSDGVIATSTNLLT